MFHLYQLIKFKTVTSNLVSQPLMLYILFSQPYSQCHSNCCEIWARISTGSIVFISR